MRRSGRLRSIKSLPCSGGGGVAAAEEIGRMVVRELLDLSPEVRRYLLARIPDI